jgi:hypothetical protein
MRAMRKCERNVSLYTTRRGVRVGKERIGKEELHKVPNLRFWDIEGWNRNACTCSLYIRSSGYHCKTSVLSFYNDEIRSFSSHQASVFRPIYKYRPPHQTKTWRQRRCNTCAPHSTLILGEASKRRYASTPNHTTSSLHPMSFDQLYAIASRDCRSPRPWKCGLA